MSEYDKIADRAAQDIQKTEKDLVDSLRVKFNEDGSASFYGFAVPTALAPFANWIADTCSKDIIGSLTDWAYRGAYKVTEQFSEPKADLVGRVAKWTVFSALVSGPLLGAAYRALADRFGRGSKLYEEFKPVMAASGANEKNNGVMKLEFYYANNQFISKIRRLWPEIPMAVVKAIVAAEGLRQIEHMQSVEPEIDERLKGISRDSFAVEYNEQNGTTMSPKTIDKAFENHKKSLRKGWMQEAAAELPEIKRDPITGFIISQTKENDKVFMGGVGAAKQALEHYIKDVETGTAHSHGISPWEMIKNLHDYVEETVGPTRKGSASAFDKMDSRQIAIIRNKVKDIFQKYENDMDAMRRETGEPEFHYGEITGAGNVKALNEVSQAIAEAIGDGAIDARALVDLVGNDKVINHSKEKRTIDVDAANARIRELGDKLGTVAPPDPKEFFDHFDSPDVMKDALKKHLNEMQGVERASFASLFSDNILKATGLKQEEITAMRQEAHSHMYKLVSENIRELATKSQEELTNLQIKEEDVDTLVDLSRRMDRGDRKALKSLLEGRGRGLLQNILGVAALQELETDKDAWTKRVAKSEETRPAAPRQSESARTRIMDRRANDIPQEGVSLT